jgi:hypothetical protein
MEEERRLIDHLPPSSILYPPSSPDTLRELIFFR